MRRSPRRNVQSIGASVFQDYSAADLHGNAYPKSGAAWLPRTIDYGGRNGWSLDSDGLPVFGLVSGTIGPLGGFVRMAPTGGTRHFTQWGLGGVPCLVTTVSPLKVTPVWQVTGGSPYATDTTLGEITCVAPTSYTPTVGDPGTLMQGTDLHSDQLMFLPYTSSGGGGGGGGGGGYYGDGSDGAIALSFDAFGNSGFVDPYSNSSNSPFTAYLGSYNGVTAGQGGWNDDTGTAYWVFILNRDIYCTTLTVPATLMYTNGSVAVTLPVALFLNGYRIFCTVSCDTLGSSKITGDGWGASGGPSTPGKGAIAGVFPNNGITWMGGASGATGPGIFNPYPQCVARSTGSGQSAGTGSGFAGVPPTGVGLGVNGVGGPSRTAAAWVSRGFVGTSGTRSFADYIGGCGGATSVNGATPGAGGAPVFIAGPAITGIVTSNGAKGFAGTTANQPGGGGGNPGPLYLIGETISATLSSSPGAGGAGNGTGAAGGAAGGAGLIRKFNPVTNAYS